MCIFFSDAELLQDVMLCKHWIPKIWEKVRVVKTKITFVTNLRKYGKTSKRSIRNLKDPERSESSFFEKSYALIHTKINY